MSQEDNARAFLIAMELIEQHGDDVETVLETTMDRLSHVSDWNHLSAWFVIRNAVTMTLSAERTRH